MSRPVPNAEIGARRGHDAQSLAKIKRDKAAWEEIAILQMFNRHLRLTLRDYADHLTRRKTPTAQGGAWSEMQVSRVFKVYRSNPKKLYLGMTIPLPFERKVWPQENYAKWLAATQEMNALTDVNGSWHLTVERPAARTDLVRLMPEFALPGCDAEGQVSAVRGGRYTVIIIDFVQDGTFEIVCPATSLETWVWKQSRLQRIRASDRLRERYFRPEGAVFPSQR